MGNALLKWEQETDPGQGGTAAGGSPDDWNKKSRDPSYTPPKASKPPMPKIPQFNKPLLYSPQQSTLQRATSDIESTSHQYLQRFGASVNF